MLETVFETTAGSDWSYVVAAYVLTAAALAGYAWSLSRRLSLLRAAESRPCGET